MKKRTRDLISPVQMPVEFHTLFFIIRASTANQGKRKHMSFFCIHLTANKSNHLFLISHFLWHGCDCLSVYFSTINPRKNIVVLIYAVLCCGVLMVAQASTRIFSRLCGRFFLVLIVCSVSTDSSFLMTFHRIDFLKRKILSRKKTRSQANQIIFSYLQL